MVKVRSVAVAAILSTALILSACGAKTSNEASKPNPTPAATATPSPSPSPSATPTPTPAATAINAEAIVKQNCIACHGDTLDGKGSEKKNLQKIGARMNKDQIAKQIADGGGGMPGMKSKLKEEEIAAVAAWLEAKK
ncbi:c-type cytochrome [Paenibacillus sp. NPDC056579]|uniref:c-type cytochrome n=1 Tax=unclassified Paenibacillus TaxID=185978 RepID=UPI001EF99568|nr:cytochrome c [Paenibacillus sp. H1-7]ULL16109.1 cytochrome c [Paenibacillus sp. H1-7]